MMKVALTIKEPQAKGAGTTKLVGLDASKASIAVAVADSGQAPPRYLGAISNVPEAMRELAKQPGKPEAPVMCYKAGPAGYGLQRLS